MQAVRSELKTTWRLSFSNESALEVRIHDDALPNSESIGDL